MIITRHAINGIYHEFLFVSCIVYSCIIIELHKHIHTLAFTLLQIDIDYLTTSFNYDPSLR